jgi:hypothetical protein
MSSGQVETLRSLAADPNVRAARLIDSGRGLGWGLLHARCVVDDDQVSGRVSGRLAGSEGFSGITSTDLQRYRATFPQVRHHDHLGGRAGHHRRGMARRARSGGRSGIAAAALSDVCGTYSTAHQQRLMTVPSQRRLGWARDRRVPEDTIPTLLPAGTRRA